MHGRKNLDNTYQSAGRQNNKTDANVSYNVNYNDNTINIDDD